MANKNPLLGGTDWVDGDILYADDLNDTNDIMAKGVTETIEDSALVANTTTTYTFPTRKDWTQIKILIYATGTGAPDDTDLFRINGNSGASDYKFNSQTTNQVQLNPGVARFLRILASGDEVVAELNIYLVNDRIHFRGGQFNVDDASETDTVEGFMDTTETKISSVSFRSTTTTISGRIKILGMQSE